MTRFFTYYNIRGNGDHYMSLKPVPELLTFLASLSPEPTDRLVEMAEKLKVITLSAGEIITHQGDMTDKCYFILKGMVRKYALDDEGNETTYGFYSEMQSVVIYYENDTPKPSPFSYICVEDTLAIIGDSASANEVANTCPELVSLSKTVLDRTIDEVQETLANYIRMTPEARVKHIADTKSELFTRVPQHQLASYLGITPESLSRIKKRLGFTAAYKPKSE